jgi:hypothetical protein
MPILFLDIVACHCCNLASITLNTSPHQSPSLFFPEASKLHSSLGTDKDTPSAPPPFDSDAPIPFREHQRTNLASGTAPALLRLLKAYKPSASQSITVSVVGFPNVGKSSLINTLRWAKVCCRVSLGQMGLPFLMALASSDGKVRF